MLVTGATSGIGFHTARELAVRGASVLITGRDRGRGEDAVKAIASAAGHDRVGFIQVDHSTVGANSKLGTTVTDRLAGSGSSSGSTCLSTTSAGSSRRRRSPPMATRPPSRSTSSATVHGDTTAFWWAAGMFALGMLLTLIIVPGRRRVTSDDQPTPGRRR